MAISIELRDMLRDSSTGLTDSQVCERTGIGFATWRRMLQGHVPSDAILYQYAKGLDLDPAPFVQAAAQVRPKATPADLMRYALEQSGFTPSEVLELMNHYRELLDRQKHNSSAA